MRQCCQCMYVCNSTWAMANVLGTNDSVLSHRGVLLIQELLSTQMRHLRQMKVSCL